jgi:hypothetical protein
VGPPAGDDRVSVPSTPTNRSTSPDRP